MQIIERFDFFPLTFDEQGKLKSPEEFDALIARANSAPATDAIFIAHGFLNDASEATRLYTNFLTTFRANLSRPEFKPVANGASWSLACSGRRSRFGRRSATNPAAPVVSRIPRRRWPTRRFSSRI